MNKTINKGDTVWIYLGGYSGLTEGKVLEVLDLKEHGYAHEQYLIEVPTSIDPVLVLRDFHTLSDTKEGPLFLYRRSPKDLVRKLLPE